MVRVLVPLAEGFEEIEAISVIDILRRADIEVVTAGLKEGLAEGSHKVKVLPDTVLDKIDYRDFDGLILPGGAPGFINLGNDQRILDMARRMDGAGKCVAAIERRCAAGPGWAGRRTIDTGSAGASPKPMAVTSATVMRDMA